MENPHISLSDGKELVIQVAPFELGYRLTKGINRVIQKTGIQLDDKIMKLDFSEFTMSPAVMVPLAQMFLSAMEDDSLEDIFWACANHCTYDGLRITKQLFNDNIEMRGVFYEIKLNVLKENLLPFFPSLRSWFTGTTSTEK